MYFLSLKSRLAIKRNVIGEILLFPTHLVKAGDLFSIYSEEECYRLDIVVSNTLIYIVTRHGIHHDTNRMNQSRTQTHIKHVSTCRLHAMLLGYGATVSFSSSLKNLEKSAGFNVLAKQAATIRAPPT